MNAVMFPECFMNECHNCNVSYLLSCCSHMPDISSTNLVPSQMHCNPKKTVAFVYSAKQHLFN